MKKIAVCALVSVALIAGSGAARADRHEQDSLFPWLEFADPGGDMKATKVRPSLGGEKSHLGKKQQRRVEERDASWGVKGFVYD